MKNSSKSEATTALLKKAEDMLKKQPAQTGTPLSETEALKLIHELEVHQIELELQNEELMRAKEKAEAKQKESEKRLNDIIFNLGDWAWEVDENGVYTYSSEKGSDLFGPLREDIIGKTPFDFMPPDEAKRVASVFIEIVANKAPIKDLENWNIDKNGKRFCLLTNGVPILDKVGNLKGYRGVDKDITGQKHAQDELASSNSLLQATLESTADGILVVDRNGKITLNNQKFADMWRIPKKLLDRKEDEPLLNYVFDQLARPEEFLSKVMELYSKPEESSFDTFNLADGRIFERHSQPQTIGNDILGRVWSFRDVTDRKRMEEKLLESEQNYRYMFANNPQPMWIFDIETLAFLEVNQAAVNHYGYTREEFLSMTLKDIRPAEDIPVLLDNVKISGRALNPGTEWRHIRKNGEIIIVNTISHSVIYNDRDARHVLVEDITERRRVEKALKESEERYRSLIENMGEGVGFINDREIIVFANPSAEKIFGVDNGKLTGLCLNDFLSGENIDIIKNETQKRHRGESSTFEHQIVLKDGSIKDILITATPGFDNKNFIGTYTIFRDISYRKKTEAELKLKNEELQKLNAEKDKFFSIIAHDLRGPLGGLMKLTEMMADETQYITPCEQKELTLDLSHSARNIFNLLENLLEWSQMQRGLMVLKPQRLGLKELVIGCTEIVVESADAKTIELTVDIPAELEVFVDTNMFQSVIRNLVSNAIKFTPKGGKVTISARTSEDSTTVIAVKDSGIGMTSEMLNNLFRIDAKSGRPGTEGEPSTGLGLLLCKEFIEKHNGKIWAESEAGKGSVFYFTLPCDDEPEVKTAAKNVVAKVVKGNRVKNLKILIVEDDNISEKLIEIAVISYSKEILKVRTGVEAVEACRNHPDIDLVLMDIQLPVLDGYEATRQIRKFNKKVIIIAQTVYVLTCDRLTALQAGCDDFISKPINRILLNALINKCFKKKAID